MKEMIQNLETFDSDLIFLKYRCCTKTSLSMSFYRLLILDTKTLALYSINIVYSSQVVIWFWFGHREQVKIDKFLSGIQFSFFFSFKNKKAEEGRKSADYLIKTHDAARASHIYFHRRIPFPRIEVIVTGMIQLASFFLFFWHRKFNWFQWNNNPSTSTFNWLW